jgi:hypothetical protein
MDIVARWQTRGGRYWFRLYHDYLGYSYRCTGGGGNLGDIAEADAISYIEKRIAGAKAIDGINYNRVVD